MSIQQPNPRMFIACGCRILCARRCASWRADITALCMVKSFRRLRSTWSVSRKRKSVAETKYCPKCQQTLPCSNFYRNKALPSGLAPYCKACWSIHNQEQHAKRRIGMPDKKYALFKRVKHDYFSSVESPIQAYILGLLASDGNVGSKRLRIGFSTKIDDCWLVELLRDEVAPAHKIQIQTYLRPHTLEGQLTMARVVFTSPQICRDLASFGVVPQKSKTLNWPEKLSPTLYISFLLGVYDGDGWLTVDKRKVVPYYIVGFTSASRAFLEQVAQVISEAAGVPLARISLNGRSAFAIRYGGRYARIVSEWLHAELPGLARKRLPLLPQEVRSRSL
jgi:hypothetical protein